MHENHRKRVRERFFKEGLTSFAPHNVLEMLLFFSIPRADTNEIAHRLIEHFGSLEGVFDASAEELMKVDGIGENSAALLSLVPQISKRYMEEKMREGIYLSNPEKLREFVLRQFIGAKKEIVFLLCMNSAGRLMNCRRIGDGSLRSAELDSRSLLEAAFAGNATTVILAHNHPNGVAAPSRNDIESTKRAAMLFMSVNIRLADHLIAAGSDVFSMAETEKFAPLFKL